MKRGEETLEKSKEKETRRENIKFEKNLINPNILKNKLTNNAILHENSVEPKVGRRRTH